MKKRDLFWISKIIWLLGILAIFIGISLYNFIQINHLYLDGEKNELNFYKKQIKLAAMPYLSKNDNSGLMEYCENFKSENDISFQIFDEDKKLIAGTAIDNKELDSDTHIFDRQLSKWKIYKSIIKHQKLSDVSEFEIKNKKYYLELVLHEYEFVSSLVDSQTNIIIFFVICLLLLSGYFVYVFSTIRNSFNNLEDSVVKISNGDFDAEVKVSKEGLLQEISIAIKQMTLKLKNQIVRLKKLEEFRSIFIQDMTHEIKTPIATINSAIELLDTKNSIADSDRECFDIILSQTDNINKLVNDILTLSEIELEQTNENKNFTTFNLNEMVKNAISYLNIQSTNICFLPKCDLKVFANEELLITAIINLLNNAIKYSESQKIDVITEQENGNVIISVKDYGVGIQENHLEKLFTRFYRVDKARSRQTGGTGLGLAIVKHIAQLHKGSVSVESEVGKGSIFKIILPL